MRYVFSLLSLLFPALFASADFPVATNDPLPVCCNAPDSCPCSGKVDCTCSEGCKCVNCLNSITAQVAESFTWRALGNGRFERSDYPGQAWVDGGDGWYYRDNPLPVMQRPVYFYQPPMQFSGGGCAGGRCR